MNALERNLIGKTFTNHLQPYGSYTIRIEHAAIGVGEPPYYGCKMGPTIWFRISGIVIEGSETNRLFHATSTRSIVGQNRTVYGVGFSHLEKGEKITVAM